MSTVAHSALWWFGTAEEAANLCYDPWILANTYNLRRDEKLCTTLRPESLIPKLALMCSRSLWINSKLAKTPSHRNDYGSLLRIRLLFAYIESMFGSIPTSKIFVVTCKRCRRKVPYGVREFSFQSIVVSCSLCGELRHYLPSEVFLGRVHSLGVCRK